MTKQCEYCGKSFQAVRISKRFCCRKCIVENTKAKESRYDKPIYNPRKSTLTEKEMQARKLGISYGELQAMRFLKEGV